MNTFRFEDPWALLLCVGLLPVVFFSIGRRRRGSLKYPTIELVQRLAGPLMSRIQYLPTSLRILAIALVIVALARPQLGNKSTEVLSEGVDIILAMDTSGTMEALDFVTKGNRATRLDAVKAVVKEFVSGRGSDRLGMVLFGTNAFLQCPPTLDHGVLLSFLDRTEIGVAGEYTAIGSAIALSCARLENLPGKEKVIILLTDGINNRGAISPETAARIAKSLGIKIYTIGVGTKGKAPFLVSTVLGDQLQYEYVPLDEETLQRVAEETGGQYFRATDTEALKAIYKQIDRMEKTEVKVKEYTEYFELYPWFVLPALALVTAEILLRNTMCRQIP
jgi:Ca-activated chloride channel family protein